MSQKESKPIPVNTNWALLAWWKELFCVVEELDTVPPDLYIDRLFLNTKKYRDVVKALQTTQGGVLLYREISDRRDPDQLRQVVELRITMFKKEHPDTDIEFHILKENAILNDCKNDLFKNWETNEDHYNNVKDIDAYIAIRDQIIGTPRPQNKPQTTAPEGWDQVFIQISDFRKFNYINVHYVNNDKVRWTHLLNALKDKLGVTILSDRGFLRWIEKHYEPRSLSIRPQGTAKNDPRIDVVINNLPSDEELLKNY